jgi:hypothetical protein
VLLSWASMSVNTCRYGQTEPNAIGFATRGFRFPTIDLFESKHRLTMRFSTFAVLSVIASVSAFVPSANRAFTRSQPLFALEDLEAKLLAPPKPETKVAAQKPKPASKTKVEKPKPEKPKPAPKVKVEMPKYESTPPKAAAAPAKVAAVPAKVAAKASKKAEYELAGIAEKKKEPIKPRATARTTPVVEKPKPPPKAKSVVAPPKKPTESDPNAGLVGVALGAAPLVLVPFVALSAGRDFLTKTAARRAEIEAEIAAAEAAKAKKARDAQVDSAGLAKAGVSRTRMV